MLLRFACSNFRSIKEKQEILFTAAKYVKEHDEAARTVDGLPKQRVLPMVALYGANASGKSNMLKALEFLKRAALRSHVDWEKGIDRQHFRLDPAWKDEPSSFEIDFLVDGVRYHYGFVCDDEAVREEWLYAKPPGRVLQTWFNRKIGEETEFGKPIRVQGEAFRKAGLESRKSLIITLIVQGNLDIYAHIGIFFKNDLCFYDIDRPGRQAEICMFRPQDAQSILEILCRADTGLSGIGAEAEVDSSHDSLMNEISGAFARNNSSKSIHLDPDKEKEMVKKISKMVEASDGIRVNAVFYRNDRLNNDVQFSENDESRGTKRIFNMAVPLTSALRTGACLCIDELDSSLHTLLSRAIIGLFMDPKTNPKGAQLLFTTHDTNLLSTDVLRRDQVWLTEKDTVGATHVYSLADFKLSAKADIETLYLEGRFGGLPFLDGFSDALRGEDVQ